MFDEISRKWEIYCLSKWLKNHYRLNCPVGKSAHLLLWLTLRRDHDCLVFGEPPKPFNLVPDSAPDNFENQDSVTAEGSPEIDERDPEVEELDREIDELLNSLQEGNEQNEPEPAMNRSGCWTDGSPMQNVTLYSGKNNLWESFSPMTLRIVPSVIDFLIYHSSHGLPYDLDKRDGARIKYKVLMLENYCYAVKVKLVEGSN